MSDQAAAGSVEPVAPAGTPAEPSQPVENGSAAGSESNPFSGLSEGTRKWVETKGYKTIDDALAGGMNAESRLGSAVTVPAADAPPEEWDKFVPEASGGSPADRVSRQTRVQASGRLPGRRALQRRARQASKPWMHEAGLSAKQAQVVHDKFVSYMAEQAKAQQAAIAEQVTKTHDELVRDWGPLDGDGFKEKLAIANRALTKLGLVDAYKAKGILLPDGSLTDPQIARAFHAVGETDVQGRHDRHRRHPGG